MDIIKLLKKHFGKDVLTEAVGNEIKTMFDVAVSEKVNEIKDAKVKKLEEKYAEELTTFKTDLIDRLNEYIEMAVNEFAEENKPNIEIDAKVKMAENVINKIRETLKENYVEIPETEIDVVKDLQAQVTDLKGKLDNSLNENVSSKKQMFEFEKAIAFSKLTENLTDVKRDKVMGLVENINIETIDEFKNKLGIIISNLSENDNNNDNNNNDDDLLEENLNNNDQEEYEIDKYLP